MSPGTASSRVGWCPGALRPMASGDGLIVRVKPRLGRLTPEQATGIAEAAQRAGNGAFDLTSRANLQIRGASDATLPGLTAALDRLGLLDADAKAEARRNVVVSPLAGLDPSAAFNVSPAVAALEQRLVEDASLAGLPAKFGFAVSDGGSLPLEGVPADVRFDAILDGSEPAFEIRLDGDDRLVAVCGADALPETAVRVAGGFIGSGDPGRHRMRDLVARDGAAAVFDRVGLATRRSVLDARGSFTPTCVGPIVLVDPSSGASRQCLAEGEKDDLVLGVAAPFGRFDATQLDRLARGAAAAGAADLRLTAWRAILVPGLDPASAAALSSSCAAAGLIVDPADPRLRVAACVGAPGCRRSTTPTLDHADGWARLVGRGQGIAVHVSGCAKGCAHSAAAPLTLVARDGRYDAVADGRAGDMPAALALDPAGASRLIRTVLYGDARP